MKENSYINEKCRNCHQTISGNYCSHCGQKVSQEINLKPIIDNFVDKFLDLDFSFVRTVIALIIRPANMINCYLDGQRILYTNPIKTLFYIATFYLLGALYFDIGSLSARDGSNYTKSVVVLLNYLIFIFLILLSFIYWTVYRQKAINYAKAFVVLCYIWSGYLLLATALLPLSSYIGPFYELLRLVVGLVYLTIVNKNLYRQSWIVSIGKSILLYLCYLFISFSVVTALFKLGNLMGWNLISS